MSGSGSGGWTPTVPSNPCKDINQRARVNSPQPSVLSKLKLGDALTISLQQAPTVALIVSYSSDVVGTITGYSMPQIINCMENGHIFIATVVGLNGGTCDVQVSLA